MFIYYFYPAQSFNIKADGYAKGKIVIKLFKRYSRFKKRALLGKSFLGKGYFVSTLGVDGEMLKKYVKYQEMEERRVEEQQGFDF